MENVVINFASAEVLDALKKQVGHEITDEVKEAGRVLDREVRNVNAYLVACLATPTGRASLLRALKAKKAQGGDFNGFTIHCLTKLLQSKKLDSLTLAFIRSYFTVTQMKKYREKTGFFTGREVHNLLGRIAKSEKKDAPLLPARFIAWLQEQQKEEAITEAKKVLRIR